MRILPNFSSFPGFTLHNHPPSATFMQLLEVVIEKLRERQEEFGIALKPAATIEAIAAFEMAFQLTLPDDIKAFYEFCNGFETDDFLFQLLPLETMVDDLVTYGIGRVGYQFVFAEYLIHSDTWQVVMTPDTASGYQIINTDHGTKRPLVLTESISDFVIK